MKSLKFLFLFLIFSCNSTEKYYDFDEIIQYKLNPEIINAEKLFSLTPENHIDSLRKQIIFLEKPLQINDSLFIKDLENIGFEKRKVNPFNYDKISKVYRKKFTLIKFSTACEPVYRDLLIFKKNNKVIGISKICFECMQTQNISLKGHLEPFQREKDYEIMRNLIE